MKLKEIVESLQSKLFVKRNPSNKSNYLDQLIPTLKLCAENGDVVAQRAGTTSFCSTREGY